MFAHSAFTLCVNVFFVDRSGTGEDDLQHGRNFDELSSEIPTNAPITPSQSAPRSTTTHSPPAATASSIAAAAAEEEMIHHPAAVVVPSTNRPLARVESVEPDSPAATAGLRVGDRILCFGPIHGTMNGIGALVQEAATAHQRIGIRVQRRVEEEALAAGEGITVSSQSGHVVLVLAPKSWSGRGFLGCHIVPVSE
jgi:PDZ domain